MVMTPHSDDFKRELHDFIEVGMSHHGRWNPLQVQRCWWYQLLSSGALLTFLGFLEAQDDLSDMSF